MSCTVLLTVQLIHIFSKYKKRRMGGKKSKPSPPKTTQVYLPEQVYLPKPQPLTDVPWRKPSDWDPQLEQSLISEVRRQKPRGKPNLLTVGPVGAGKSSFINSILSIGKGRKCGSAATGTSSTSYTVKFEIHTEDSLLNKYRLMDCMGLEPTDGRGFHPEDIVALLKGHVKKEYAFNPAKPISKSDKYWRSNPKLKHQVHCVIFVVNSVTIHAGIPRNYVQKISQLQEKIKRADIPRILVLTQVDRLCDEVRKDIKQMFRSVKVRDAVKIASEVFGIDQASIHPVKNYQVDYEQDPYLNIPLLLAVRQALQYAEDRVDQIRK